MLAFDDGQRRNFHAFARSTWLLLRAAAAAAVPRTPGTEASRSRAARAFVQRYFPDFPLRVIPNGVDLDVYRRGLAPIRHLRDENLNVLFSDGSKNAKALAIC